MTKQQTYSLKDLELLEKIYIAEARESFYAFRRYMHPEMRIGWFVKEISRELQEFYELLIAGKRPKLAISAPPQHGKSSAITDFIAWLIGKRPDKRNIYTSFSERLGVRANLNLQRMMATKKFKKVFPNVTIGKTCNRELIELEGEEGYFRNTTVRGSITGESLDLGIIDDPLKGREAANSELIRNMIWEWLTDDFITRFSDEAGLLVIMTRWHVDDPLSRLTEQLRGSLKVVNYPAIATEDEKFRKKGEPLFPELKSLEFLEGVEKLMASVSWSALYQGDPRTLGGEVIHPTWFKYYKVLPALEHRCIYADTAQKTSERNDYSVLQCWGKGVDGNIYLIDQVRGKWEAPELERRCVAFWGKHKLVNEHGVGQLRQLTIEDKASGTGLIQKIKTSTDPLIPVRPIDRTKDKYTRVLDILGYIEAGYVHLPEYAGWLSDFIAECESFTNNDSHLHDDMIDPMCDAINDMISSQGYMGVWSTLSKH